MTNKSLRYLGEAQSPLYANGKVYGHFSLSIFRSGIYTSIKDMLEPFGIQGANSRLYILGFCFFLPLE
jgi:hypothetical protein